MQRSLGNAGSFRVPEPTTLWRWMSRAPRAAWRYASARDRLLLWPLLIWAAVVRLVTLDLIPFGLAEVQHLLAADGTDGTDGMGASGLFEQVLAFPLLFGSDPRWASGWLVALNLVALFAFHRALFRSQGPWAAHIATALLGLTPWSVLLSRQVEPVALVLPLSILLMVGLYAALCQSRAWGWTIAWLTAVLLLSASHWTAPLLLVTAALTLAFPRRARWGHVLLGALLAALFLLPTWYYAPAQPPDRAIARFLVQGGPEPAALAGNVLAVARDLIAGQGLGAWLGPSSADFWPERSPFSAIAALAGWVWLLSLPASLWLSVRAWSHWRAGRDPARFLIPAAWLWLSLLAWIVRGGDVMPFQLASMLPASALAVGLALDALIALPRELYGDDPRWTRGVQIGVALFVAAHLVWGTVSVLALYGHVERHDVSQGYGTPLRFWLRTAAAVNRSLENMRMSELWVMADGIDPTRDVEPAVLTYLLDEQARPIFMESGNPRAILLPAERSALYLSLRGDVAPVTELDLWDNRQIARVLFPEVGREADLRWVSAHPVMALLMTIPQRDWAAYDGGLRLVGYGVPYLHDNDRALALTTYWTFEAVSAPDSGSQHRLTWLLYGQDGALIARAATFGLPEAAWREGLLLKQSHALALPHGLPSGPYEMHLLIESWPDGHRHQLLDNGGTAVADRYVIGPFRFDD